MKKNTKKILSRHIDIITKLLFIFIILQPIFDVLSNLYNNGYYHFNFVTYFKPLFVFGLLGYLLIFVKYKNKLKEVLYYFLLGIFIILHAYLLYYIQVDNSVIIHEIRFAVNIVYFITLIVIFLIMQEVVPDKKKFYDDLKKTLMITIGLYVLLYLLAVITNTSWLTYEFADANKLGYRGWYFNGQIFGHILCISLPLMMYWLFTSKLNPFLKILILAIFLMPFYLIGTKVPALIVIIVSILNIVVSFGYKLIINRNYKLNYLVIGCSLVIALGTICCFKILPVYHNIELNTKAQEGASIKENVKELSDKVSDKKKNKDKETGESKQEEKRFNAGIVYDEWTLSSLIKLNDLYDSKELHSANSRSRQLYFNAFMFSEATWPFKILGIGYVNQPNLLSLERDIVMPLFSFGIIGFIIFTGLIWLILFKALKNAFLNIKKMDIELILYIESLCMFIGISYMAGYTFIYTQFAMILAIIMGLLYIKIDFVKDKKNGK